MTTRDQDYFARRAAEEHARMADARHPSARQSHGLLRDAYQRRARGDDAGSGDDESVLADPSMRSIDPFIARLRLMTSLDEGQLAALSELMANTRTYPSDRDIAKAGQPPCELHILLSGWACRYKLMPDGRRQIVALVLPGDPCDLDGILVSRLDTAVATLTAVEVAVEVAVVPRDALLLLGRRHPPLADLLLWLTTLDNAMMSERINSLGRRSARERIAHLFCELMMRLAGAGCQSGDSFDLPLTQEEIGDTTGLTAVHVNRVLQGLRNDGILTLNEQRLTVFDWPLLTAIANFDPGYLHLSGMRSALVAESIVKGPD